MARSTLSVALQEPRKRKQTSDVRRTERISSLSSSLTESWMNSVESNTDSS